MSAGGGGGRTDRHTHTHTYTLSLSHTHTHTLSAATAHTLLKEACLLLPSRMNQQLNASEALLKRALHINQLVTCSMDEEVAILRDLLEVYRRQGQVRVGGGGARGQGQGEGGEGGEGRGG